MTQQQRQRGVDDDREAVTEASPPATGASGPGKPRHPVAGFAPETFLAKLDEHERDALFAIGTVRPYPHGAALMFQDERDDRMIFLLSGRTKVARVEQDGRELMLDIRDAGDLLGELAFGHGTRHPCVL